MTEFATPEGTRRYAERFLTKGLPPSAFRTLGRSSWTSSTLGFGCYRIDDDIPEHHESLEKALSEGCNLIDTSTNYSDGGSEVCVGVSLQKLFAEGKISRDEIIVVSKVGYVQGQNLSLVQERESSGKPFSEVIKYMDGCWHCIHPDFIEDQLSRSLERLELDGLDVYLLHNPEYFFSDARKQNRQLDVEKTRDVFYSRLRSAFVHLEKEVAAGRIAAYGVSSNTFGGPGDDIETTSLSRMWDIAVEVAGPNHHFSVVQLPGNLFESGPILRGNTGREGKETALAFAASKKLAVLVNRPLNAFVRNQLVRLADPEMVEGAPDPATQLKVVEALEAEFLGSIAPHLSIQQEGVSVNDLFRWGAELKNPEILSLPSEHWSDIEAQMVRPKVHYLIQELNSHFAGAERAALWAGWRDRYRPALETLLDSIRNETGKRSRKVSQALSQKLDVFLPKELKSESLSRKSLATLMHTPGVTSVLNGMRRVRYVEDSMGALRFAPFESPSALYEAFSFSPKG